MIYHHLPAFDPRDGIALFDQPPEFLYAVTVWGEARGRSLTKKQAGGSRRGELLLEFARRGRFSERCSDLDRRHHHGHTRAVAEPVVAASEPAVNAAPLSGERGLVRAIGVRGLAANILNTTIGAGIFVLPAVVAGALGTAAPLAYLACAFTMTLVVASFAMAGSRVSLTGGIYAYVEVAFGPFVGFLTGVLIWLACLMAAASVASAMAASVGLVIPGAGSGPGKALLLGWGVRCVRHDERPRRGIRKLMKELKEGLSLIYGDRLKAYTSTAPTRAGTTVKAQTWM